MNNLRGAATDDGFGLRLSAFFVVIFFIVGCYMPFLPLWLKERGLTAFQISLVYAVPVFVRAAFTPAMAFIADRTGRPVRMLVWLSWGALASVLLLPLTEGFPSIFAVVLLFTLFWMSVIPVTDSIALAGARAGRADYGRMRLWGSLGYVAMTAAGGAAVEIWGAVAALWLFISSAICVVIATWWLPGDETIRRMGGDDLGLPRPILRIGDVLPLIRQPDLWIFLLATSTIQSAHALYYIFGTLHWTAAGISPTVIGALWGIGVIAEIVLFAYGMQVSRRLGPVQLIAIAGMAAVLRWTVTAFDPALPILFMAQALHGLTFGAAHLGAMQFLQQAIPNTLSASAQGLYASVTAGIAMGLVSLAVGPLYRNFGGGGFLAMGVLSGIGLLAAIILMKRWRGGLIVPAADQP
jgi:PPP family 3-phenylpropionic acid transporter